MSEMMLNILDGQRELHGAVHGSVVDAVVAALSADPETIEELQAAVVRFQFPLNGHGVIDHLRQGINDVPWDAGICVIDMPARLVAWQSTYTSFEHCAGVTYHNGQCATEHVVPFHVADHWEFTEEVDEWRHRAKQRRQARVGITPIDTRKVLYGKVAEFIAEECCALAVGGVAVTVKAAEEDAEDSFDFASQPFAPPANWQFREVHERFRDDRPITLADAVAEIHARWLMTPRADLGGRTPREVLLADKHHLAMDLQHREHHWSIVGECPLPLSRQSFAYRFAGYGTHEAVLYYELVRDLTWSCFSKLVGTGVSPVPGSSLRPSVPFTQLSGEEMILAKLAEIERLNQLKEDWLHTPDYEDLSGRVPAEVIEQERQRLPMAMVSKSDGGPAHAHESLEEETACPLCEMMDMDFGPMFWHLDGCNMDEDFAFDIYHATREEYDEEERQREEFHREWREREAARERGELVDEFDSSPWTHSYSKARPGDSLEIRLFGIAAHLGELTTNLCDAGAANAADTLNRQFANLREALAEPDSELIDPVIDRFGDELFELSHAHPALAAKCDDLAHKLSRLTQLGDDEIPF